MEPIEIPVKIFRKAGDFDSQFFNHAFRHRAVRLGALDRVGAPVADQGSLADAEFVALGVSAEVVVVFEDEDARVRAGVLAIEMRGGEAADAAADDDEVVGFAGVLRRAGRFPERAVAQAVRGVERAGMAAAQAGERGRIVVGRLF